MCRSGRPKDEVVGTMGRGVGRRESDDAKASVDSNANALPGSA